jgi:tetratricopeptide (TPR) repeat protein
MTSNLQAASCKSEGDALYREKNYHVAIMKYTQVINLLHPQGLTPTDESTFHTLFVSYSNRCACFLQVNRVEQALQDAKQCVKLKPDWPKGYARLGSCYHKLGNLSEAVAAYEKVLAIDHSNEEAKQILRRIRQQQQSKSTSNHSSRRDSSNSFQQRQQAQHSPSLFTLAQFYLQSVNWQQHYQNIQRQVGQLYARVLSWLVSLSPETQKCVQLGLVVLVVYYFFFYRSRSYDFYYPDYSSYGHSYYSGGGGMSWTTWAMIMAAAYFVPPRLQDQLGPMYARPFFGMNWTTFVWLLNMLSRNGNFGGGFGRPMYGGGFGGRRRY